MAASVFIFLFACLLAGLLYRFPLRRAATRAEVGRLALVFAFVGLFFLANALLAHAGRQSLLAAIRMTPVSTWEAWEGVENGAPVVLAGLISPDNPRRTADYVAYIECDDDACTRDVPAGLLVTLDGGLAVIGNDDFQDRAWPVSSGGVYSLSPGQPVIVVGAMERGVILLGPDRGKQTAFVRAEVVYAGSHEGFVARARRSVVFPTLMVGVNLVAVGVVILLPWAGWCLRARNTTAARRERPGRAR